MAASILLNKLTHVVVDQIPCCGGLHKHDNDNTTEQTQQPQQQPAFQQMGPKKFNFTGKPAKYEDSKWISLPVAVKRAAKELGHDKDSWNNKESVETDHYHWHDFSDEQKEAAETMGWDYDSWEHKYENLNWADLPKTVQEAATLLGFTSAMWDEDTWPSDLYVEWEELSDKQRNALHVLGYTKESWK